MIKKGQSTWMQTSATSALAIVRVSVLRSSSSFPIRSSLTPPSLSCNPPALQIKHNISVQIKNKDGHIRGWETLYLIIVYGMPESAKYCSALRFHTKILPFPMLLRGWLTSVPPIDPTSTICFTPASLAAQIIKDN